MAPFNQRQIGYIQAIAGRQQHTSLLCGQHDGKIASDTVYKDSDSTERDIAAWEQPQAVGPVIGSGLNHTTSAGIKHYCKSLLLHTWHLDAQELGHDSRLEHNNQKLMPADFEKLCVNSFGQGVQHELNAFDIPLTSQYTTDSSGQVTAQPDYQVNPYKASSRERLTPDGFLNSTDIKFRFTLPGAKAGMSGTNPMGQDHYEFRWIVWRAKKPQMHKHADENNAHTNLEVIRNGASFRNPGYDFFKGQSGRKRGMIGYTYNPKLDKLDSESDDVTPSEVYSGFRIDEDTKTSFKSTGCLDNQRWPDGEAELTVDDLMTMPINRDDYVVMKDSRFFLGKEHGKSHFEEHLHWDWNDPIETSNTNVLTSPTLNNKNYRWHFTLIGTNNGITPVELTHQIRWTTKCESG